MARLNENPVKVPLQGNEGWAATDPSSGADVGVTPVTITQYAQLHMALAAGSTQGAISGPMADKLAELPNATQLNHEIAELAQVAIPIFISSPVNGTIQIYQHVCEVPWVLSFAYGRVSAGSTNVTIQKNGNPIAGLNNCNCTTAAATFTATDTLGNRTFAKGDVLSVQIAGSTGSAANLMFPVRANATITP